MYPHRGLLLSRASSPIPGFIAGGTLPYVAWSYRRFRTEFFWEKLPFSEFRKASGLKPPPKGALQYVQPELLEPEARNCGSIDRPFATPRRCKLTVFMSRRSDRNSAVVPRRSSFVVCRWDNFRCRFHSCSHICSRLPGLGGTPHA